MGILSWIILGGVAGWLASLVMKRNDQMGCLANILAGVIGAVVGGWVFSLFTGLDVTGLNLTSLLVFSSSGREWRCRSAWQNPRDR